MVLRIQTAKLKIRQYLLRANSPKFNAHQIFPLYSIVLLQTNILSCLVNVNVYMSGVPIS